MTDDDTSNSSSTSSLFTTISASSSGGVEPVFPVVVAEDDNNNNNNNNVRRRRCVGGSGNCVTWGCTSVIGYRKEMEDAVKVVPGFVLRKCDDVGGCVGTPPHFDALGPVHFFAVYDGHGGAQVAKFCEGRMHEVLAEEWDQETVAEDKWHHKWEVILTRSFERADNEILTNAVASETVGSTAVVVLLSGCQIITSNCGDSRAVLCRGSETIPLSIDQKPDREDELARIEDQGGHVIHWHGARVFGVLAMSRAIGDHHLRPWVIPVPEITFTTRRDDDECLVLASDGLWDVMSNDEVGEVARGLLRKLRRSMPDDAITAAQTVADNLTEIALTRNSSDNISIVVVDLKPNKNVQPNQ